MAFASRDRAAAADPRRPGGSSGEEVMRREDMIAVPDDAHEPGPSRFTGVTCPECPGALTVQAEGESALVFQCRIGHLYSQSELIFAKEKRAEDVLWAAVEALEELAALLRDTGTDPERARRAMD